MAKSIPHRELRNSSAEILRRVRAGETFEITNNGEVVAVLSPPDDRLPAGVSPATVHGGFAALTRATVEEPTEVSLDILRSDR